MKRFALSAVLLAAFALSVPAATFNGVLMDKPCASAFDGAGQDAALEHSKTCALLKDGKKKGFVIVTDDGASLELDTKGNRLALKTVEITKRDSEVVMEIQGEQKKDRVAVDSLRVL